MKKSLYLFIAFASAAISSVHAQAPKLDTGSSDWKNQAMEAAAEIAGSVDWANMSWADISQIPYEDKAKLIEWATPQVKGLMDKLSKAAMSKGVTGLSSLGDTGWQGAIKSAASALEAVKDSSPETWEMARGALMSSWEMLQKEAEKFIGQG
jgi:hypothetical protein